MENDVTKTMSLDDLKKLQEQFPNNESLQTLVSNALSLREREAEQAAAKEKFTKEIDKLIAKLPHPEDVSNIYIRWAEVEEEDTTQDAQEVEITAEDGTKHTEVRYPVVKGFKWVVSLNKAFTVSSSGNNQPQVSKRAISVYKFNGTTNDFVGNFTSASKACEHLNIPVNGDSASRVLEREGYIRQPYTGTEYTA
jgi:hypothetical protein